MTEEDSKMFDTDLSKFLNQLVLVKCKDVRSARLAHTVSATTRIIKFVCSFLLVSVTQKVSVGTPSSVPQSLSFS